jgi:ribosomal protein L29
MTTTLYERDHYAWLQQQTALLREGRVNDMDVAHLIEELEDMGSSRERELESRLGVLLAHLLEWRFQPERQGKSWQLTIKEQRLRIAKLLGKNPGLKLYLIEAVSNGYEYAILMAARETGLDESIFPEHCPYTQEQILDDTFWPD